MEVDESCRTVLSSSTMGKIHDSKSSIESKSTKWIGFWNDVDTKYMYYLFFLSLSVRLFIVHEPSVVVFDEVHFGGFASNYLNRNYYMDVHPPLAKMLVALTGWIAGLSLDFRFDLIGIDYIEANIPYIFMRIIPAILGAMMVPLAYIILRSINTTSKGALWTSLLILFENAFLTQFRLILLDAYLAFGTAAAFTSYCLFRERNNHAPFSIPWWSWITLTGLFLGFTVSCKWVGLFTIATIGVLSVIEMWLMLADTTISMKKYTVHFISRISFFLLLPIIIYISSFYAHFLVLSNVGLHGTEMSPEFQQTFVDCNHKPTFRDVGIGSIISLRHHFFHECFLHSHSHYYPTGSKQQQLTLYSTKDENNLWRILPAWYTRPREDGNQTIFVPIRHGDIVRLEHVSTGSFMHSHPVDPPISHKDHYFEASCYGSSAQGIGDTNDHWRVEITDSDGSILYHNQENIISDNYPISEMAYIPVSESLKKDTDTLFTSYNYKPRIKARRTLIRLVHVNTGCYLTSFAKKLPEWGFGQLEVTCGRDSLKKKAVWIIDTNENPNLPDDAKKTSYLEPSFLQKFMELQKSMWQRNEALTADHYFGSRPSSWFVLDRGLGFWNGVMGHRRNLTISETIEQGIEADQQRTIRNTIWQHGSYLEDQDLKVKNKGRQIYLIGNPITWWIVSAIIIAYTFLVGLIILTDQRKLYIVSTDSPLRITSNCGFFLIAWILHYFPFFLMKRQLFLHHYLPAYYFGILLSGYILDHLIWSRGGRNTNIIWILTIFSVIYIFVQFSPLSYGLKMSKEHCLSLRWLSSWDFDCDSLVSDIMPRVTDT